MSISMLLDMAAQAHPDRVALGTGAHASTYAELARTAAGGARLLRESGAPHVVFVGINGPIFPTLLFAAAHAGIPVTPLNYRLTTDALIRLIDDLGTPLVLADPTYARALRDAGREAHDADRWYERAAATHPLDADETDGDASAVVLFTSGTTATPKGVVLRHRSLLEYVLSTVDFASAPDGDTTLVSVPTYHVAGITTVLTNVYAGRRLVYLPDFTPQDWLDLVRDEAISHVMLVPTMLARIVGLLQGAEADTPGLRSIAYGGARMPRNILEQALAAFPDAGFTNAYGLTETSSTIAVLGPDDHRAALADTPPGAHVRLGSVGRLVPGVEGRVLGPEGRLLATGESGELWVRGGQVSGEYLGTGSGLDAGGWFPTRDRARFDADGYLFVEGRADDTIIRGGENIAPAEIEDVLIHHPAIREAAVVGIPDDEWGERITAVVVTEPGAHAEPDDIRAWVRARLRGSRTPDDVVFRADLPYTPTGKLLRGRLVADVTANG